MLSDAQTEADRVLANAQSQAMMMLEESELVKRAEQKAEELLLDAHAEARRVVDEAQARSDDMHRDADEYAFEVLSTMESELKKHLMDVQKGRALLERVGRQPIPQ